MDKRVQAKDISDERCIEAVRAAKGMGGARDWSMLCDVNNVLSEFPPKVVQAKLAALIKKKKITGCACGCRGDFEVK